MFKIKGLVVFGTRPEIIKLSPLFDVLHKDFNAKFVHTGQHYSYELDRIFFEDLHLRFPDYLLDVGSASHANQIANILLKLDKIILKEKPDFVLVQGDTNSTLAGGLMAGKSNILLAHLEAGCRSFNKSMPEEINRIVVDHLSDKLLAPDKDAYDNLIKEGIDKKKIDIVGSTSFDACSRNITLAKKSKILDLLNLDRYVLVTVHRAENTDNLDNLASIVGALNELSQSIEIVFSVHPRTRKTLFENNIRLNKKIKAIEPVGYLDFLALEKNAQFIMTDSGGIQEEAAILSTPCLILRNETEWTRFVKAGKNLIVGVKKENILRVSKGLLNNPNNLKKLRGAKIDFDLDVCKKVVLALKKRW